MRVRDWRAHGGLDVLVHALGGGAALDDEVMRSVMEARRLLLADAARLAAERRDEEQAALLATLAAEVAAAPDDEAAQGADFAFFATLIAASGNLVLLLVANSIRELYFARLGDFRALVRDREALAGLYASAAEAVAAGDAERRRRAWSASSPRRRRPPGWRGCREAPRGARRRGARRRGRRARAAAAARRRDGRRRVVRALDRARAAAEPRAAARGARGARARAPAPARPRAARLALLRRLGGSPLAEGLRATAAVSYYGDAGVLRALGHDRRPRCARPRRGAGGMTVLRADACVIGSGAGGAVAAAELAEGGHARGRARGGRRARRRATPPAARATRCRASTATAARSRRSAARRSMLPLGRGTGGTTFVNSGTCFRTPAAVLERWSDEHGSSAISDAYFERVERGASASPRSPPELAGRNAAMLRRGAERLGWSGGYLRRNARGCQGSGVCAFGCPTGAKQHVGEVYLPRAPAAGATLVTGARAERILVRDGRAAGVEAATRGGRSRSARTRWSSRRARSTRRCCSRAAAWAARRARSAATSPCTRRPPCGASSTRTST